MILNEDLFKTASPIVKPEWFLEERTRKIYAYLLDYYTTYERFPSSVRAFQSYPKFQDLEPKERSIYASLITGAINETQQYELPAVKKELTEWLHANILITAVDQAMHAYNTKQVTHCYNLMQEAVKKVQTLSFDRGDSIDFLNFKEYLKAEETNRKEALTTGLKVLDRTLLKGTESGGLQKGDMTVIMAPVNRGKSLTMITMACHNVRMGHDVLFMTHEGRPEDIRLKILSNMLKIPIEKIMHLYKTDEGIKLLDDATKRIDQHLRYVPYNRAGMTIEDVVPVIRSNQNQWQATHDKGFDMLVSDYPAILTSELAKKGSLQKRNVDQVIYDNYVQLALEYNFHSLVAIQTNREGSKVSKRTDGNDRILQSEDVQESFGPIQQATNIITVNRSPWAEANNIITFGVAKCRNNQVGSAVIARSDFACSMSHSEEMGGMHYVGTKLIEEKFNVLFAEWRNQTIPGPLLNVPGHALRQASTDSVII